MSLYVRYQPLSISGGGGSAGTVTSVGLSDGSTVPIFTISGSPVTTSGTLTFTLKTETANTVFAGPTTGAAAQPGFRALVAADIPAVSSVTVTRATDGATYYPTFISGNSTGTYALDVGTALSYVPSSGLLAATTFLAGTQIQTPHLIMTGAIDIVGSGSGDITIQAQAAAGTYNLNLPTTAGTSGYLLTSAGGGSSAMTWTNPSAYQPTVTIGALDAQAENANGLALVSNVLSTQSADATHPGVVNNTTQSFAGVKSFTSQTSMSGGSVSAPGLYLSTDTSSGLYRPGVDQLNIGILGAAVANFGTSGAAITGALSATTTVTATTQLISSVVTGTAPLVVSSTTQVANLNAATAGSATTATTATNLAGGAGGSIPYQSAASTTAMLSNGTAGQVLTSAGTTLAPTWATPTTGTVTSVAATVPGGFSISGSPITSSGTLAISANGTSGGVLYYSGTTTTASSGLLATNGIVLGGGAGGAPTTLATNASTTKILTSGGTNTAPVWADPATSGTVTSVAMTVPASSLFSVSGSPITSSGTLAVTTAGTSGGIPYFSSTTQMNSSGLLATNGLVLGGGAGATPTTLATSSSTTAALISGGTNTAPSWGTLAIGGGGTGQTSKAAAFDALQPMTTGGDIIYGGASGTGTRLANGTAGTVLTSAGTTLAPTWSAVSVTSVAAGYQSSAAQSITSTAAVVKFATQLYDTNSAYSGSTGNFTAPSAGKYLITGYIQSQGVSASSTGFFLLAYKNGSLYARIGGVVYIESATNVFTASGSAIIDVATNDTIALWASSDTTVSLSATATNNSIFIQKLGN